MASTILVAEDDASVRSLLELILELEGYEVVSVADGRDALRVALEMCPDVVLLDLMMPEMDGLTVVRHLRADDRFLLTPILMLSARSSQIEQDEGALAGVDEFLEKPIEPTVLTEAIERALDANLESGLTNR